MRGRSTVSLRCCADPRAGRRPRLLSRNPASGRRRRLKVTRPRPVHLDTAEQMAALLDAATLLDNPAAPGHNSTRQTTGRRACIAALMFAGLRADEVGRLLWR